MLTDQSNEHFAINGSATDMEEFQRQLDHATLIVSQLYPLRKWETKLDLRFQVLVLDEKKKAA